MHSFSLRPAWAMTWRHVGDIRLAPAIGYLRGLTVGRAALLLVICLMLTMRQHSLCIFQITCGMPDGGTLSGFTLFLARQFVFSVPLLLLVTVADNVTARETSTVRIAALSLAVLVGSALYGVMFLYTQPLNVRRAAAEREWLFIVAYSSRALLYGGLATAVLYFVVRERGHARGRHAARLEKASLERQMIEARLQALQAQIEPHFLFNTLANIKMLYAMDPSRAKPLIHDLRGYLCTALPLMRDTRSTLGRELDLASSFLRILQVRMEDRLHVVVDVPADLRSAALPPMMLLTLVENAVKHGLGPLPRGGTIVIRATRSCDCLEVSVRDDGAGFAKGFGAGVGLANTRARLAALYGASGRLVLDTGDGGGVVAALALPYEVAV